MYLNMQSVFMTYIFPDSNMMADEQMYMCSVTHSCPTLATSWTIAHQAPLSMEFFRQEYWSALPFPVSGIFSTQRSNPCLLHWQADSLSLCHMGSCIQRPLLTLYTYTSNTRKIWKKHWFVLFKFLFYCFHYLCTFTFLYFS